MRATARVALALSVCPLVAWAATPLPLAEHVALSGAIATTALLVARAFPAERAMVAFLSVAVSARYVVWRLSGTLIFEPTASGAMSLALIGAELFGFGLLLAGYFQAGFTRPRVVLPLPDRAEDLPTVDVFVPTYDEDVPILRRTLVGVLGMRYPRMRVYLLDEQKRPAMHALCEELGVTWMTRPDNAGAKAGNLNHALARTDGELVVIFDADQAPVRSFLDLTVPPFLEDPRLALVQTPHHFINPDPFARNLHAEETTPAEHLVFYHLIQTGNDFWNSAFFCGSSAVLRRSALLEVGGIATETVTEDAHTAMKLHALGWRSAYVAVPLAAGLATERFGYHVTQRVRWARGMLQILRLDNPLLKSGLTLAQRLNYVGATAHFLFGIPRLVYLLAPPAYLLFGVHPLDATAAEVAAYALPHVFLSVLGGSVFTQGSRHSFQAEVYETAIAPFVALVTVLTFLSPRHARFRVTVKGSRADRARFDVRNAAPNLVTAALVMAALGCVPWRWAGWPDERGTVLLAAGWNLYNLVILLPALAVALDRPQRRAAWRLARANRVRIAPEGAPAWEGRLLDLSEEGCAAWGPAPAAPALDAPCTVSISSDRGGAVVVAGTVKAAWSRSGGAGVRLAFHDAGDRVLEELVRPANAWVPAHTPLDRPWASLLGLVRASVRAVLSRRGA